VGPTVAEWLGVGLPEPKGINRETVEGASGRTTLFPMTTCDLAHGKIIAGTLATPGLSTASNWVYALAGGNRERTKQ
jgi:hypothetical protein